MGAENSLKHIAIIMDGNNRWAKKRGLININGHKAGVERIRDMLTVCRDQKIQTLTLFAFSSENWNRPRREVEALMRLFHSYLTKESPQLKKEGVRLRIIGGRDRFSDKVLKAIDAAELLTKEGESQQCWGVKFQNVKGELVAELSAADYEAMKSAGRVK